ncbi:hypothetical protein D0Y65_048728 [Glycine soja]|uniref:F-box domain-containing protein n=1 Tax=Glycine soja TaxID=3848 RepID=A0A445FU95_GLYSO|nr:hypothetical protein D0Y65_048728 [Glycine soja]
MQSEKKPWSPLLCDELIEEILSRIPVKPLIQFKCVCKGWNSLMSDPYFIKLHLSKSAAKDDLEHLQLMKNVCLGSIPEIHTESCDRNTRRIPCLFLEQGDKGDIPENRQRCLFPRALVVEQCLGLAMIRQVTNTRL